MSSLPDSTPTSALRFIIVSPTFNHGNTLAGVLDALNPLDFPIIVVDDGSIDSTSITLKTWQAAQPLTRSVITHAANKGKAAALQTGFAHARALGFTHALTIDSDGQHSPVDLHAIIAQSIRAPQALIVGARPYTMPGCPMASTIGRFLSNHFIWLASGVRVTDSQSGLRSYPLAIIETLKTGAGRYAFETEVLTRAGWAGTPVLEVPITCNYQVTGGRITHFRVGRDTFQAIGMHAKLIARSIFPGHPVPRLVPTAVATLEVAPSIPDPLTFQTGTIFHRACWWLSPRRIWLMARGDNQARERLAASVAVGLFMATVPVYGIKTVACLWLSAKFRLHPTTVIAISSLSTPPIGFVFAFISIFVGHLLLHGTFLDFATLPRWSNFSFSQVAQWLTEWITGSLIVGSLLALLSYGLLRLLLCRKSPAVSAICSPQTL